MIVRLIKATVGNLEYEPHAQFKFHLVMSWVWLVVMVAVPFFAHNWFELFILELSLYSNFASDFTGMSAALSVADLKPKPKPFTNPNYKPPVAAGSLGLGWDEAESEATEAAYLDSLAKDDEEDVANF
jgi:hypothetical protein